MESMFDVITIYLFHDKFIELGSNLFLKFSVFRTFVLILHSIFQNILHYLVFQFTSIF